MRALLAALLAMLAVAACTPQVQRMGPPVVASELNDRYVLVPDGVRLPLREWLPEGEPKAVVVALHGFNDYSNAYADPGPYLASRGIAVYAYDQRGFGEAVNRGLWAGLPALARDLAETTRLIAARHPGRPVHLLGESMGGAVALVAMAGAEAPPVDGVILSAPAVWGRQSMNAFERGMLWLASRTVPWLKLSARGLDITPSDNEEMLRALGRDPLVIKETRVDAIHGLVDLMDAAQAAAAYLRAPALVLYGEKDEIVPAEPTYRAVAGLPDLGRSQRFAVYPDGYHMLMRDLQAEVVLRDITAWIEDPAAPLPSGADANARRLLAEWAANQGARAPIGGVPVTAGAVEAE